MKTENVSELDLGWSFVNLFYLWCNCCFFLCSRCSVWRFVFCPRTLFWLLRNRFWFRFNRSLRFNFWGFVYWQIWLGFRDWLGYRLGLLISVGIIVLWFLWKRIWFRLNRSGFWNSWFRIRFGRRIRGNLVRWKFVRFWYWFGLGWFWSWSWLVLVLVGFGLGRYWFWSWLALILVGTGFGFVCSGISSGSGCTGIGLECTGLFVSGTCWSFVFLISASSVGEMCPGCVSLPWSSNSCCTKWCLFCLACIW